MNPPAVIIVGAGAAGLAAAQVLDESKACRVLLLEARNRIGGRILTLREPVSGIPLELGAEFIHGRPATTWDAVQNAGLIAYDVPFEHMQRYAGRMVQNPDYIRQLRRAMSGISRARAGDMSFADYLRTHRRGRQYAAERRVATDFVEGFDAADTERISARSVGEEQEGLGDVSAQPQYRLLQGYGALMEHLHGGLSARVTTRLQTAVSEIYWKRGMVKAHCASASKGFCAARIIITLPIGILQRSPEVAGSVRFIPDLGQKRAAAMRLGSGDVIKVILKFRESFWETGATSKAKCNLLQNAVFMHDTAAAFPTWWTARPLHLPILTGWVGGPKASKLSGLSQHELRRTALESVSRLLGRRKTWIMNLLESCYIHDWPADPWACGAYSYETVGGEGVRRLLAQTIDHTLYFAGEAVDTSGQASTVAGALSSGQRAAKDLLASIG